jgi:TPR repeat protein
MTDTSNLSTVVSSTSDVDAEALFQEGLQECHHKRYEAGISKFTQASAMGHGEATNYVGQMYEAGEGVNRDLHQAKVYYELSIKQGNTDALLSLGHYYEYNTDPRDNNRAIDLYQQAANQGNIEGLRRLAELYLFLGRSQNSEYFIKCRHTLEEAIRRQPDNNLAYDDLANLYYCGYGVEKNPIQAAQLITEGYNRITDDHHKRDREYILSFRSICNSHPRELFQSYVKLSNMVSQLQHENQKLRQDNTDLRTELYYCPDGPGFEHAKADFYLLANTSAQT